MTASSRFRKEGSGNTRQPGRDLIALAAEVFSGYIDKNDSGYRFLLDRNRIADFNPVKELFRVGHKQPDAAVRGRVAG